METFHLNKETFHLNNETLHLNKETFISFDLPTLISLFSSFYRAKNNFGNILLLLNFIFKSCERKVCSTLNINHGVA